MIHDEINQTINRTFIMDVQKQLLRDPDVSPTGKQLKNVLGKKLYGIYDELFNTLTSDSWALKFEWNYYKDGKAWLCKVIHKKKTVFWLSVWENFIKTGFYFTEKTRSGVLELDIADAIKIKFAGSEVVGKLIPLSLDINGKEQLKDLFKIAEYKKNLK